MGAGVGYGAQLMGARTLFLMAGLVWGVALGLLAAAMAAGLAAAVFWGLLYGDGPWPAWSGPAMASLAVAAGAAAFLGALAAGRRLGRRAEAADAPGSQRRRALVLLVLGLLALAAVVALGRAEDMPEIESPAAGGGN